MVFANLGPQEKDAFFSLLDEYFASRPEILTKGNNINSGHGQSVANASSAAASAVRNAVGKHPEAAAKYMTAGLKQFAAASSSSSSSNHGSDNRTPGSGSGNGNVNSSNNNKGTGMGSGPGDLAEDEAPSMAGRIAAAQAMFSGKHNPFSKHKEPSPSSSPTPPPPPSYGTSSSSSASGLKTSGFSAPPVRKTPSSTPNIPRFPPPPVAPPPPIREERGEWVEALYDYDSGEAGDLKVTEGQRILLVERTSDDWWTGEVNGNKGLVPASYVKVL